MTGSSTADRRGLQAFARWHAIVLATSWLLATAVAIYGYTLAPTTAEGVPATELMVALQRRWAWYTVCYGLFLVADLAIALLGVVLAAWLSPARGARAIAMIGLFALAGVLGMVMDVEMLVAAQTFRSGAVLQDPAAADVFLARINTLTAWLSAGSFAASGAASLLIGPMAERAGAGAPWIRLTRALATYQVAVAVVIAAAAITASSWLELLALAFGVIGMPILASLWLRGLVREIGRQRTERG
jgi:hypothetical protein